MDTEVIIPNGCFTVENTTNGTHRTVKVHTARKGNLKDKRIISLLVGCNNDSDYAGFGFVENGVVKVWSKHQDCKVKTWLAQFVANQFGQNPKAIEGVNFLVEKRCIRCNRRLTTPESIKAGIGPECAGKF